MGSYEESTEAEYRLRSTSPIALWDAYGLPGRRADLTGVQDRPLPLEQLRIADGALVFRLENRVPGQCPDVIFRPTTATRSRQTKKMRAAVAGSPRTSMPSTAAPAAPMPTQTP